MKHLGLQKVRLLLLFCSKPTTNLFVFSVINQGYLKILGGLKINNKDVRNINGFSGIF